VGTPRATRSGSAEAEALAAGGAAIQIAYMERVMPREDPGDEHIRLADGVVPYRYLERIAIAHVDGGLSLREAHRLAAYELANEGAWVPG
jgi:spermidine/putrescine-binding protein